MKFFRLCVKMISKVSPLVLFAGGVVIALALLSDRRGSHLGIVKAVQDALMRRDKVENAGAKKSAQPSDLVKEALQSRTVSWCDSAAVKSFQASAKVKGHRVAVAAKTGVLSMKDKAQDACKRWGE
ncbi:MAG: hypothetical protein H7X79_08260 [Sporomusaceae bacterium]|nr:hypothetical protein [Sporomusaceae bacterium]